MARTENNKIFGAVGVIDPMATAPYEIKRVIRETHDTFTFELISMDSSNDFRFAPGQFNMLYLFGIGEVPISISGDPDNPEIIVHTIRNVGSVTGAMAKLKSGDSIGIRGPFGTPWPVETTFNHDVLIVAGGIGLAPLRPVIYYMLNHREKFDNITILYGARTPDDILFRKELKKWRGRFDLETHVTVDRTSGAWHGNVGVVTNLIGKVAYDPSNTIAMMCGPEIMMRFTVSALLKRDFAEKNIYVSMERNMKCGIGLCGHCQMGTEFICKDGPVYSYDYIKKYFVRREI